MKILPLLPLSLLALATAISAQTVVEIPAMTVSHSVIDMDSLPLGVTTLAALNAAGSNGGAGMANILMIPKAGVAAGVYNTNVCGYALAAGPGTGGVGLEIIDASGGAAFDAMTIQVDFTGPATEFGMSIADWGGNAVVDFYSGGALVVSFTTSSYGLCTDLFFQMNGGTFDSVNIDVASSGGNWCAPSLTVEQTGPSGPSYAITGLVGGGTATLAVTNATAGGAVLLGYSLTGAGPTMTPFGPVDMSPPISQLPTLTADAQGFASMSTGVPSRASGFTLYTQGADLTTGSLTNSLAEFIL